MLDNTIDKAIAKAIAKGRPLHFIGSLVDTPTHISKPALARPEKQQVEETRKRLQNLSKGDLTCPNTEALNKLRKLANDYISNMPKISWSPTPKTANPSENAVIIREFKPEVPEENKRFHIREMYKALEEFNNETHLLFVSSKSSSSNPLTFLSQEDIPNRESIKNQRFLHFYDPSSRKYKPSQEAKQHSRKYSFASWFEYFSTNGTLHGLKDDIDSEFKQFIKQKYSESNTQGQNGHRFSIITDSLKRDTFKIQTVPYEEADNFTFQNDIMVIVDNGFSADGPNSDKYQRLGKGIDVLPSLTHLNIPIFYQTGHAFDSIPEEEKELIRSHESILLDKNVTPKTYNSKERALAEIKLSQIIEKVNPSLSKYFVQTLPLGEDGVIESNGVFISFSRRAVQPSDTSDLEQRLAECDLEKTLDNERMYVLSELHSTLNLENEDVRDVAWERSSKKFYDFDTIYTEVKQGMKKFHIYRELLGNCKEVYEKIVEKHEGLEPTVLAHGDTKEDNWFADHVLGDFGSSGKDTHYADIAKALALCGPEGTVGQSNPLLVYHEIEPGIKAYHHMRSEIDDTYKEDLDVLKKRVCERVLTESLRTLMYKPHLEDSYKLAMLADDMALRLKQFHP